jgi:hypothetical protein
MLQRNRLFYGGLAIVLTIGLGFILNQSLVDSRVPVKNSANSAIVRLNQPFQLKVNQTAQLPSEKVEIQFVEMQQDSRCPVGVQCVWQGQATVAVHLKKNGQDLGNLTLKTNAGQPDATTQSLNGYSMKLVDIAPQPKANQPIPKADYVATFVITE